MRNRILTIQYIRKHMDMRVALVRYCHLRDPRDLEAPSGILNYVDTTVPVSNYYVSNQGCMTVEVPVN